MARKSDAVRLAELELMRAIVTNPAFTFVVGIVALETLQKHEVIGNVEATAAELALGGIVAVQALSPIAPVLLQGTAAGLDMLRGLAAARVPLLRA